MKKIIVIILIFYSIGSFAQSIKIGKQIWKKENLSTITFRNGDTLMHAQTKDDWKFANQNKIPAWCYYKNETNGEKNILYNWYAINDSRKLAPLGWRIPNYTDFQNLLIFYGDNKHKLGKKNRKRIKRSYKNLKKEFKNATNDSLFILSHEKHFDTYATELFLLSSNFKRHYFELYITDKILNQVIESEKGEVIGPLLSNGRIYLLKIISYKPVETASMQIIILQVDDKHTENELMERARKIMDTIIKEHNFSEMVELYSDDPGSINNQGYYKNFPKGMMTMSIEKFVFNNPIDSIAIVTTDYGPAIVKITGHETLTRPEVLCVSKNIYPDDLTTYLKGKNWDKLKNRKYIHKKNLRIQPVGYRSNDGIFYFKGLRSGLWLKEENSSPMMLLILNDNNYIHPLKAKPGFGFSVRCIKEE